jgi:hypothetical protein
VTIVVLTALSLASSASASTAGQRNALSTAKSYLSMQGFSKSGLVGQLKYEGYSGSDSRWAVAHVGVSWYWQAFRVAKSYLRMQSFSKSGLVGQLEYDGFTHSQAVSGANKAYG